jgi:hypothetical protein
VDKSTIPWPEYASNNYLLPEMRSSGLRDEWVRKVDPKKMRKLGPAERRLL